MKIIKIEVYTFLIYLTIINLIAIVTSVEYIGDDYNFVEVKKTMAIVTIVASGLQLFSSIIFIIIPRKGSRILFFLQLLITLCFFIASTGYFLESTPITNEPRSFRIIFISVEGLNGLSGIIMLLILGREAWGDLLTEDEPNSRDHFIQPQGTLPRFQPPPQVQHQQSHPQYGYGQNKPY